MKKCSDSYFGKITTTWNCFLSFSQACAETEISPCGLISWFPHNLQI